MQPCCHMRRPRSRAALWRRRGWGQAHRSWHRAWPAKRRWDQVLLPWPWAACFQRQGMRCKQPPSPRLLPAGAAVAAVGSAAAPPRVMLPARPGGWQSCCRRPCAWAAGWMPWLPQQQGCRQRCRWRWAGAQSPEQPQPPWGCHAPPQRRGPTPAAAQSAGAGAPAARLGAARALRPTPSRPHRPACLQRALRPVALPAAVRCPATVALPLLPALKTRVGAGCRCPGGSPGAQCRRAVLPPWRHRRCRTASHRRRPAAPPPPPRPPPAWRRAHPGRPAAAAAAAAG